MEHSTVISNNMTKFYKPVYFTELFLREVAAHMRKNNQHNTEFMEITVFQSNCKNKKLYK